MFSSGAAAAAAWCIMLTAPSSRDVALPFLFNVKFNVKFFSHRASVTQQRNRNEDPCQPQCEAQKTELKRSFHAKSISIKAF